MLRDIRDVRAKVVRVWRHHFRPFYGYVGAGVVVTTAVLLLLQGQPLFTRTELAAYDFHFQVRGNQSPPSDIVYLALDATSIADLNDSSYPIPRRYMASAINFLHAAGARAIVIDFLYERSRGHDDIVLANAMRRAGNVVQADRIITSSLGSSSGFSASVSWMPPTDQLLCAPKRLGLTDVPEDNDGVIRAYDLQWVGPSSRQPDVGCPPRGAKSTVLYPSLAVEAVSVSLDKPVADVLRGLPDHMYINYVGSQPAGGFQETYPTYQFEGAATGQDAMAPFRNKIVIIGCGDAECSDTQTTPYGPMYGPLVQANAIATILRRDPIVPVGGQDNSLIVLVIGLVTTIVASRFGIWSSIAGTLLVGAGYAAFALVMIDQLQIWMNLVTPETTVVLAFAAIMALRFSMEERQKRRTKRIFGEYVKPEIVDILVSAADEEAALAGARRPISVLFVDVRGFTAMSEQMEPEDVVSTLDIYLEELTGSVTAYDGTLDKYVGDEIMAIWNAPHFQHDHPLRAVLSGLDMIARMDNINEQLAARGLPHIAYGIGVNTGEAVVGRMGSKVRKQYDVIGDAINTGARLCSAAGRGEIIIGELTWNLIGDLLVVEETEPLKLKGKSRPFRTFRVLGLRPAPGLAPEPAPAPA